MRHVQMKCHTLGQKRLAKVVEWFTELEGQLKKQTQLEPDTVAFEVHEQREENQMLVFLSLHHCAQNKNE